MRIEYSFLILALLAEILGTIGGFGSSVFFVPLGNFYFDFHSVLGMTAIFHLSSNLSKIALFKKGLNKFLLLYIGLPSVIFVVIGGFLTDYLQGWWLEILLGAFLTVLSLVFLLKPTLKIKQGRTQSISGGVLSGFAAGLLGTGGAIRGLTMAAFNLEKQVFIATSAFIDFFTDLSRTVVYVKNGYVGKEELMYVPFLLLIGLVGTWIGRKILTYIPQEKFKKLSLLLILFIGVLSLIRALKMSVL